MPAAITTSPPSASSASIARASRTTRSRSAARPREDCSIGELVGPGFSYEQIVDAVETVVDTYLGLRLSPEEPFLDAVRRVGLPPFKEALYGQRN